LAAPLSNQSSSAAVSFFFLFDPTDMRGSSLPLKSRHRPSFSCSRYPFTFDRQSSFSPTFFLFFLLWSQTFLSSGDPFFFSTQLLFTVRLFLWLSSPSLKTPSRIAAGCRARGFLCFCGFFLLLPASFASDGSYSFFHRSFPRLRTICSGSTPPLLSCPPWEYGAFFDFLEFLLSSPFDLDEFHPVFFPTRGRDTVPPPLSLSGLPGFPFGPMEICLGKRFFPACSRNFPWNLFGDGLFPFLPPTTPLCP